MDGFDFGDFEVDGEERDLELIQNHGIDIEELVDELQMRANFSGLVYVLV